MQQGEMQFSHFPIVHFSEGHIFHRDTDSSHNNDNNKLCNKFCKNVEERNDESKQYQGPEYEHHNKNIESYSGTFDKDNELKEIYSKFEKKINLDNEELRKHQSILNTKSNHYHRFNGQNAVVAILAFGNNQEDSVIFNATSIENDEILININSNYENGLSKPNTLIDRNLFYSNERLFRIYNFTKNEVRDIENIFRRPVYVDHCTTFVEDDICYFLDMPRREYWIYYARFGIIPDIIVNLHTFPSRMTVGHLIEMFVGKCMVMDPQRCETFFDASIESNDIKNYEANYIDSGIPIMEKNGEAFIGVCYYTALQHQIEEKNVLSLWKGKSQNGGLRIGEMEKDALIAHRANAILKIKYCNVCHSLGTKDT
ncbi:beta and beta-prime subunits of DNA dependent RNA-polymerase [Neocallimastix sp. 'constans']